MRRLPIFFLLDVSESMAGENLRQLQSGIESLTRKLKTDPHALETVYLSTIVFAGKAKTLNTLTELAHFQVPRLYLGSGTSLGAALEHLMNEIDKNVIQTSMQTKGDWRPVVFLMTDGKPTDNINKSLERWNNKYSKKISLVAIGIGKYAALDTLKLLTENVFKLENNTEKDFIKFIDWVSLSIMAQSRTLSSPKSEGINLIKNDETFLKKIDSIIESTKIDEDIVVITGKCSNNQLPYMFKYEKDNNLNNSYQQEKAIHNLTGVFPLENEFYDLSDDRVLVNTIDADLLNGNPGCPHCGNSVGLAICSCGQIMCINGPGTATCPACKNKIDFQFSNDSFEINRSRG